MPFPRKEGDQRYNSILSSLSRLRENLLVLIESDVWHRRGARQIASPAPWGPRLSLSAFGERRERVGIVTRHADSQHSTHKLLRRMVALEAILGHHARRFLPWLEP